MTDERDDFETDILPFSVAIEPEGEVIRLLAQLLKMFDDPQFFCRVLDDFLDFTVKQSGVVPRSAVFEGKAVDVTHHRGHHQLALLLGWLEPFDELEDLVGSALAATCPEPARQLTFFSNTHVSV